MTDFRLCVILYWIGTECLYPCTCWALPDFFFFYQSLTLLVVEIQYTRIRSIFWFWKSLWFFWTTYVRKLKKFIQLKAFPRPPHRFPIGAVLTDEWHILFDREFLKIIKTICKCYWKNDNILQSNTIQQLLCKRKQYAERSCKDWYITQRVFYSKQI